MLPSTFLIPWAELRHRPVAPDHDRCLVLCASCNAPLGVLDTPPASDAAAVNGWMKALARIGLRHKPQHPEWALGEPRVSLLMERDIPTKETLVNLLGRQWPEVLERLGQ
ncbi:MAG: hypothetical protein AB7L91_19055 [Dehalococcoidia bacterium]